MGSRRRPLHLVDGTAQIHRAFFAIRGLTTSRGLPTNATYGFTTMLRKLLADERPELIGIAFDVKGPTFRHEAYAEYKANRPRMDDDLAVQLPYVRRVCEAFRLPILEVAGVEADDVIATLARQAVDAGFRVVVVSADKDLLQLVGEHVSVLNPGREGSGATLYDAAGVEAKMGVPPDRVVDLLALMGDAVDNVPGVPGIGEKGARDLIREHGCVESLLDHADQVRRKSYREGLLAHREQALLSKRLVTLRDDVAVSLDLEALRARDPDREAVHALFSELEFTSLAREYAPVAPVAATKHRVVADGADLARAAKQARESGKVSMSLLATSGPAMRAQLLGAALAWRSGESLYVPLAASRLEGALPVPADQALETLRPLLEDPTVEKLSSAAKNDAVLLGQRGVELRGVAFDAVLAAYLIDPGRRQYALDDVAREHLGEAAAGGGDVAADAEGVSLDAAARAACRDADVVLRLAGVLGERLEQAGLRRAFDEIELPLIPILAAMERVGVKIDRELLGVMSREMEGRIEALTAECHRLAGEEFNLNSPPQLRAVLFDKLGLKSARKTAKTRAASTAEDVLEDLAAEHDLPRRILEYRAVQKLKSTYVDALPQLVDPRTGRIHASFNQTVAATGRLSSSDPNLQNIPIRTAEGRRIREAFVSEDGWLLLSADYSQIELRVLAHLSGDESLSDAFRRGEDIHDRTSREVFGPFSPVPPDEQRRRSKMINYALLYGKTAFTLAKDIGVSRKEAQEFIDTYFARHPGVRRFIDETLDEARRTGRVRTLLGRLRRLPDLKARNAQVRMEAERQAMNTPVQGSAADLIKKAMIDLARELDRRRLRSRLILQIHDELLLEVPEAEAETARKLVREVMEGALPLDVPLVADARLGRHWGEVH